MFILNQGTDKIFKTLDEQVEILREKGLVINDEKYAKEVLFRENYFFLHGYRYPFLRSKDNRVYLKGTTFEELYSLFLFDRQLRNIIFKNILIIENNIKSIFSYQLSKKYGYKEKDYLNLKNFNTTKEKRKQVNDLVAKMKRQMKKNIATHSATMHYLDNYGYIPLWILVKVLSFGILSEFYNILKSEDALEIADLYHLSIEEMSAYLSILANFRNLCAHEDILYDHRTQKEIPDTRYHHYLHIDMTDDHYNYGKNDLFAVIIIMKQMLSNDEFNDFLFQIGYEIDILDSSIKSVPPSLILNKIGFPDNWRQISEID